MPQEPQHSPEIELAILGTLLLYPENIGDVLVKLNWKAFYDSVNSDAYRSMQKLYSLGKTVDYVLLTESLKDILNFKMEKKDVPYYVSTLTDHAGLSVNLDRYVDILNEKWKLRKIHTFAENMVSAALAPGAETEELTQAIEEALTSFGSKDTEENKTYHIKDLLLGVTKEIEETKRRGGVSGLSTGYRELDDLLGGLHPGEVNILAGCSSMGKTALGINIATRVAMNETTEGAVLIFSLEMNKSEIVKRIVSDVGEVSASRLKNNTLHEHEIYAMTRAMEKIQNTNILINDNRTNNINTMLTVAKKLKEKHGLCLVVIDFIQLIEGHGKDGRAQEMAQIARSLKKMAGVLQVPILALSQLSRTVAQRNPPIPRLSDLRDSGAIEESADNVLFLYRPEYYKPKDPDLSGRAIIIIDKQRNGPTGKIELKFEKEYTKFKD